MNKKGIKIIAAILAFIMVSNLGSKVIERKLYVDEEDINAMNYASEIEEYDKKLAAYAQEVRKLDLTDIQLVMKVMDDVWDDDIAYAYPENLINGYERLSFQEEGVGVCTSLSDDFTAKINAINPEYDAKNLVVFMTDDAFNNQVYETVDINRNIKETSDAESTSIVKASLHEKIYGNHVVTKINIPDEDYDIIVDTTNLSIGTIKNGKIYMFNTKSDNTLKYVVRGNYLLGGKDYVSYPSTFYISSESNDELEDKWGYEAQSEAYNYVLSL